MQDRYMTSYKHGDGWTAALVVRFNVFDWLGFQAEFNYIARNYAFDRQDTSFTRYAQSAITKHYIDFPLLANLSYLFPGSGGTAGTPHEGFRMFTNLGGWVGVWVASHQKSSEAALSNPSYFDVPKGTFKADAKNGTFDENIDISNTDSFNRFDGGLIAGVGVQYDYHRFKVFAEWRNYFSMTDMAKSAPDVPHVPSINWWNWTVTVGLMINSGIFTGGTQW
jgi:hypothetical protein